MTETLPDTAARDAIRHSLGETLVVEAAAGTGKTTELVRRIVAVLASGAAPVEGIVAVTFTEKAAGELKLRLRAALEEARRDAAGSARANLERAVARLEEARVSTIHGFCADLLRERPVEAGVDPRFTLLDERSSERLYREAFRRLFEARLMEPSEGIRRSLRRPSRDDDGDGKIERLTKAGWALAEWRDQPSAWRRPEAFDRRAEIDARTISLLALAHLTARAARPNDHLFVATARFRTLAREIETAEAVRPRDHDLLESVLVSLSKERDPWEKKGYGAAYAPDVPRQEVLDARETFRQELASFAHRADADLAALLREELRPALDGYAELKRGAGALDFLDLLLLARDLLRDHADVRAELQERFARIFVDEFQDTDPLQAEILLLLASADPSVSAWRDVVPAPGKLFLVGDPKQAIYRFRRADVGTYREVTELLASRGARAVSLSASFRAVPALQRAVNTAFAPQMTGDAATRQAAYVPLAPVRDEEVRRPSLVALPVPDPYGRNDRLSQGAVDVSLPKAVGAFVEWLLTKSDWTVTERERPGEAVPVAARHVCVLFRRFTTSAWGGGRIDVTRAYVEALEARGIRHLLVGGKSFHEREEVEAVRAALCAVEWPDDELSVYATLHGPLFAIQDDVLFEWRERYGRLHPFRIPEARPGLAPVAEALDVLARLSRGRNRRAVSETLALLLEETHAQPGLVLQPAGEQALANVLHLAELARAHERAGGLSFRSFVERLREEAESGEAPEAPILEEGSDGVRLMTVHRAKGLEFPVVVLADITAKLTSSWVGRYVDPSRGLCAQRIGGLSPLELLEHEAEEGARDRAEGIRIAYVAATRARDVLVVPAVGDDPFPADGWTSPLHAALYPERRDAPSPAPGVPAFGGDSVRSRPESLAFDARPVRPGLHRIGGEAGHDVVWWSPAALTLEVEARPGLRRGELLLPEPDDDAAVEGLAAYEGWRAARDRALVDGERPSLRLATATERSLETGEDGGEESPDAGAAAVATGAAAVATGAAAVATGAAAVATGAVEVHELPREEGRPAGRRFGTLVHAVLATAPLDGDEASVAAVATREGRILGASATEVSAAAKAVSAALRHPLLARARAAAARGECRRETPVTLMEMDGTLVEGVVDLAFREEGAWIVVDFKTDRDLGLELPAYRRQVALYARAVASAMGEMAHGVLLRV